MDSTKTAWLFPGEGSQFAGMGRDIYQGHPPARRLLERAAHLSGHPLVQYCCWRSREDVPARTDVLQPAVTAVTLGCLSLLRDAGYTPTDVAGHGLGAYAALCAAGVLTVEETLRLVVERSRLMQEASERHPGGMMAVTGLRPEQVEDIASHLIPEFRMDVAVYNAPDRTVVSGDPDTLRMASRWVKSLGGRTVMLRVSGAWHGWMMEEVRERFAHVLGQVEFRPPRCTLYLDTTGAPETEPARIAEAMCSQVVAPVRWTRLVDNLFASGVREFIEVGPGQALRNLLRKRGDTATAYRAHGVDGPRGLSTLPPVSPLPDALEAVP